MNDINIVMIIGRLSRDADLKYTTSGKAITKFSIAVNRKIKKEENWIDEVSFFNVVFWGKLGEALNQFLKKEKQVAIRGELNQNRWEKDGRKNSIVEIIANNIQLIGGKLSESSGNEDISDTPF